MSGYFGNGYKVPRHTANYSVQCLCRELCVDNDRSTFLVCALHFHDAVLNRSTILPIDVVPSRNGRQVDEEHEEEDEELC